METPTTLNPLGVKGTARPARSARPPPYRTRWCSLLPLMKLRLATPGVLIDLGRVPGLSYILDRGGHVAIGALTRHRDVETSELLARELPLLAHAAGQAGDPQIRHRGTIGGSLAHGDPASDLPAVILALDATLVARGPSGEREIAAGDFFQGLLETALAPDELLTEIRVPQPAVPGWGFQKFTKRGIDWAIVGVAVQGPGAAASNQAYPGSRLRGSDGGDHAGAAHKFERAVRGVYVQDTTLPGGGGLRLRREGQQSVKCHCFPGPAMRRRWPRERWR